MPKTIKILCACGEAVSATTGLFSSTKRCACGKDVRVPSSSEVGTESEDDRQHPSQDEEELSPQTAMVWSTEFGLAMLVYVLLAGVAFFDADAAPFIRVAGFGSMVLSHFVLVAQAARTGSGIIVLALIFVPFFGLAFVANRFDLAKWPVLMFIGGIALGLVASSAV